MKDEGMGDEWILRIDGTTPSGGAYAEIVFYDHDGHRCMKSNAHRVVINEYDKKGRLLKSTYGLVDK